MTTSGSTLFNLTRNQLIEAALRKLGVLAKGSSADTEDLTNGMQAYNAVTAQLATLGMPLWARTEHTLTPLPGIATYTIGVGYDIDVPFPLKINAAYLIDTDSGAGIDMEIASIYEYYKLSPSTSSGTPIKLYYQPLVNYGIINLWPTPDDNAESTKTIKLIYQRPLEDFTSANETMDFPKEWYQVVIYKLACALAPEYGIPLNDRGFLQKEAEMHLNIAEDFGNDNSSVYFVPDKRRS